MVIRKTDYFKIILKKLIKIKRYGYKIIEPFRTSGFDERLNVGLLGRIELLIELCFSLNVEEELSCIEEFMLL